MKLTELLTQEGLVTPDQLEAALQEQRNNGDFLARILVKNGALKEERLLEALARQPGIARIDLASVTLDPALTDHLSEEMARKRGCLPVKLAGNMLTVAMLDPLDASTIEFLSHQTGHTIKPAAIAPSAIEEGWRRLYGRGKEAAKAAAKAAGKGAAATKLPSGKEIKDLVEHAVQEISDAEIAKEERRPDKAEAIPLEIGSDVPPIIRLSNLLLLKMIETDASDLRIEPQEDRVRVRYRIDGALHEMFSLPVSIRPALTSRFKIMSEMDVAEHRIPQDGRIKLD
ncbi:MAG: ATPase, T2SS/T4P/T4SS family, partial [Planctomycetota bacterium]|nr:ATPase, T2SS/T4P/T4SS family [Planctomycetota bacterium]